MRAQVTFLLLFATLPSRGLMAEPPAPHRAWKTPDVKLELSCDKTSLDPADHLVCTVVFHDARDSHLVYVPRTLFPFRVPYRPETTLSFIVRAEQTGKLVPNSARQFVDVATFGYHDLVLLAPGGVYGQSLDLTDDAWWSYALKQGRYTIQAHVKLGILGAAEASPKVRKALKHFMEWRYDSAKWLVLDGELGSNVVVVDVR